MGRHDRGGATARAGKVVAAAAAVVAVAWLAVVHLDRLREAAALLADAQWAWVLAAVAARAVSMGALTRQQRRLLAVGGTRISLAGALATTYAGNAISVGLPLAGPAAATLFAMRRFVALGADPAVAGWALAVSGVFSSFALVTMVAADAACLALAVLAVGGDVPWRGLLLAWAAGTAVASLGLTPGGLGVVEAALGSALVAAGLAGPTAIAAVLLYRVVSLWPVVAVGGVALLGLGGPRAARVEATRPG